jgi:hypothetical protein
MISRASLRNVFMGASIAIIALTFTSCTKNVPQSETYQYVATPSDWAAPTPSSPNTWEYFVNVPGITPYILNNKAVLVYWDQTSLETLMPFTVDGVDYSYVTGIDNNGNGYLQVDVSATGVFASTDPSTALGTVGFKVVIIPN